MTDPVSDADLFAGLTSDDTFRAALAALGTSDGGSRVLQALRTQAGVLSAAVDQPGLHDLKTSPGALEAALGYTFRQSDLSLGYDECAALVSHAAVLTIEGSRQLRLSDEARGLLLDKPASAERRQSVLQETAAVDAQRLGEVGPPGDGENGDAPAGLALPADTSRLGSLTSAWMRAFLRGSIPDLEWASPEQLRAAVAAREALQATRTLPAGVPDLATCQRLRDRAELLEPLRMLVGAKPGASLSSQDRFVGREAETERLRAFVDALASRGIVESVSRGARRIARRTVASVGYAPPRLMTIVARGGLGKSTLMAKFVLDHALNQIDPFPFVYLDFDRAALQPRDPLNLLPEIARQVALQFPDAGGAIEALRARVRETLAGASPGGDHFRAFRDIVDFLISPTTFLVVLDTLELIQSDPGAVSGLVALLTELVGPGFPELCVVAAGRAAVPELVQSSSIRWSVDTMALEPLSWKHACEMTGRLGSDLMGSEWNQSWAALLAGSPSDTNYRREPLALRVAVEFLRQTPAEQRARQAEEIKELGEAADNFFVGRLYDRRILNHIGDENARKLAWPGLIARRLTRDLARTVFVSLCGIEAGAIDAAFDRLAREVWIVERDGDELRHRADLRARTLPLMRRSDPERFAQVVSALVDYFSARKDPSAADLVDRFYYRLLRGDAAEVLDPLLTPSIVTALGAAVEDFEPGSFPWSYGEARFASRLLDRDELRALPDALAWDHCARAGLVLRELDDRKVEPRVLDLIGRPAVVLEAADAASARQTLLIKSGRWREIDVDRLVLPGNACDATALALFIGRRIAVADSGPSTAAEQLIQQVVQTGNWRTAAHLLPVAARWNRSLHAELDRVVADGLPAPRRPSPRGSDANAQDRAAVRTAVVFGEECRSPCLAWWRGSQPFPLASMSKEEVLALLAGEGETVQHLRESLASWIKDATPVRLNQTETLATLTGALDEILMAAPHPFPASLVKYFEARDEEWILPFGYALEATGETSSVRALAVAIVQSYEPRGVMERVRNAVGLGGPPKFTDAIQIVRFADEASGLRALTLGFKAASVESQNTDLLFLAECFEKWNAWKKNYSGKEKFGRLA